MTFRIQRVKRGLVPGLMAVMVMIGAASCGYATAALPADVATPGTTGHYKVGNAAAIGSYVLTVNRVLYPSDLDGVTPSQGMKFLVIDMTIKTVDAQNDRISPAAQMTVKDAKGTEYILDADVTPATDMTTSQLPDTIPALGSIHGEVAYQVPVDATGLQLVFNPSFVASLIGHGHTLTIDLE